MSAHDAQATEDSMGDAEERLEQIFQRVEEESKRRALAAAQEEARTVSPLSQIVIPEEPAPYVPGSVPPSPITATAAASARPIVGDRRRGSVSVSRFGQVPVASATGDVVRAETPTIAAAVAYTANPSAFYTVQHHHGSADSLASITDTDAAPAPAPVEDESSVVQMATISGRQSLSRAFGRRLSRAKTPSIAGLNGMLIGVSVEEATVEHHTDDEDADVDVDVDPVQASETSAPEAKADGEGEAQKKVGRARAASRSIVYVGDGPPPGSPLTSRPSTSNGPAPDKVVEPKKGSRTSLPDEAEPVGKSEKRWLVRAKDFTKRLKRKSMVAIGAAR